MKNILFLLCLLLVACQPAASTSTRVPSADTEIVSASTATPPPPANTMTPTAVPTIPTSTSELQGAELPPGFSLIKFAEVPRPTAFAFDAQGRMYITSQEGNLYLLSDDDHDGRADNRSVFASGFVFPLGVAVDPASADIYVSHQGVISILQDTDGDLRADQIRTLVGDLPFGEHQNDNLEFGPDGLLYIGVGSTCNACDDTNPLSATILRIDPRTGEKKIFATGLRNPYGLTFQPGTGQLFATDNGRDDLGMDAPFEELNHIVQGADYGYPGCWNEQDQPGCSDTLRAVAFFEAHSSADGLDFYNGIRFPAEYRGNVFLSIFGSWLKPNVQSGIQRVVLVPSGNTYKGEASWFVRFPTGAMPLPVASGPDDALYVGDYINGVIYRISYGMP